MSSNELSHIDSSIVHLLSEPDAVRARYIHSDRFIEYRRVADILNHLEYLANQPLQTRAWGLGVVGPTGAGKTMLAKALERRLMAACRGREGSCSPKLPAVMISMTGAREARTINNRILEKLKAPVASWMNKADRESLILHLLREAGTMILIVDEIQDVLSSTPRQQRVALDHIKFLMNSLGRPVAVFGIPGALEAMKLDPHLAARFDWRTLPLWRYDNETRTLLKALERWLPLRKPSDLASPAISKLIIAQTRGNLARIVKLVNYAAVFAVVEKTECITESLLRRAATEVPPIRALINTESDHG